MKFRFFSSVVLSRPPHPLHYLDSKKRKNCNNNDDDKNKDNDVTTVNILNSCLMVN